MLHASADINQILRQPTFDRDFPHAPLGWTRANAEEIAREEDLSLSDDHWETIRALQAYYAHHEDDQSVNLRKLHDALDEHFHQKGGLKYLYTLFPGGPIAQSCRLAGLKAPFIASDPGFGSVA
jgi:tRNA 2-thiouridine synthesizing protein E